MDNLHQDLWALYRAGLIEARMREDGEWIFDASSKVKSMSETEIKQAIEAIGEYDIVDGLEDKSDG